MISDWYPWTSFQPSHDKTVVKESLHGPNLFQTNWAYADEISHSFVSVFAISTYPENSYHYENTPIQIYWKFYHQKMAIFQIKNLIFFIFLLKTCFWAEITKIMYTPVNPSFTI